MAVKLPNSLTLTEEILNRLNIIQLVPTASDISYLLQRKHTNCEDEVLYSAALETTLNTVGNKVNIRGIIEFSNICESDCYYCGIRKSADIDRFKLTTKEILDTADVAIQLKLPGLLLQAGEQTGQQFVDQFCDIVKQIKSKASKNHFLKDKFRIIASVGELTKEQYKQIKEAGADRYLLRIESTNPELFGTMHPLNQTFQMREKALKNLQKLNFMLGTGVLIGVPNQTPFHLANDILYFRQNKVDMIGMGPYIPAQGTPMAENYNIQEIQENLHTESLFETCKRMISTTRLVIPKAAVSATTALEILAPKRGRVEGLKCGANVVMPILTPPVQKAQYSLYNGKGQAKSNMDILKEQIEGVGRVMNLADPGDPLLWQEKQQ